MGQTDENEREKTRERDTRILTLLGEIEFIEYNTGTGIKTLRDRLLREKKGDIGEVVEKYDNSRRIDKNIISLARSKILNSITSNSYWISNGLSPSVDASHVVLLGEMLHYLLGVKINSL